MKNVFGGIMMGCGILVAGLSGLCLLFALASTFLDASVGGTSIEIMSVIPAALIFAGIPIAIGVGLFFGGRALMNAPRPAPMQEPPVAPEDVRLARPPEDPPTG